MRLNIGDKVQLKSGGPIMVVKHIYNSGNGSLSGQLVCIWIDDNKCNEIIVPEEVLDKK